MQKKPDEISTVTLHLMRTPSRTLWKGVITIDGKKVESVIGKTLHGTSTHLLETQGLVCQRHIDAAHVPCDGGDA